MMYTSCIHIFLTTIRKNVCSEQLALRRVAEEYHLLAAWRFDAGARGG